MAERKIQKKLQSDATRQDAYIWENKTIHISKSDCPQKWEDWEVSLTHLSTKKDCTLCRSSLVGKILSLFSNPWYYQWWIGTCKKKSRLWSDFQAYFWLSHVYSNTNKIENKRENFSVCLSEQNMGILNHVPHDVRLQTWNQSHVLINFNLSFLAYEYTSMIAIYQALHWNWRKKDKGCTVNNNYNKWRNSRS